MKELKLNATFKNTLALATAVIALGTVTITPAYAANSVIQHKTVTYINGNSSTESNSSYYSNTGSDAIYLTIGESYLRSGNVTIGFGAPTYIQPKTNSTMLPLRAVATAVGSVNQGSEVNVSWDNNTKTATVTCNNTVATFSPNSNIMTINGNKIEMTACTEIKNGQCFVPLRALANALDIKVDWSEQTKTVKLYK